MKVIYAISCNDRYYIGSAVDFSTRVKSHKAALIRGTHVNKFLQNVHDKYGAHSLQYKILENVKGDLYEREQVIIDRHFDDPKCMNINPSASHPTPNENSWKAAAKVNTGIKRSDECKRKMSESKKELIKKNPDFLTERQAKGLRNRYAKLPEFVLIKEGIEYGPFKQQQEAAANVPLSKPSITALFSGRLKEVKGFSIKFTTKA